MEICREPGFLTKMVTIDLSKNCPIKPTFNQVGFSLHFPHPIPECKGRLFAPNNLRQKGQPKTLPFSKQNLHSRKFSKRPPAFLQRPCTIVSEKAFLMPCSE